MPRYEVFGTDAQTNAPATLVVERPSVPDAADFARARGMLVNGVRSAHGESFVPGENGAFFKETVSRRAKSSESDLALIALSLLIPIVGVIAGSIRLALKDTSGLILILLSFVGAAVWAGIVVGMR